MGIKEVNLTTEIFFAGSILVTFTMEGALVRVTSALEVLYLVVAQNQFSFPFFGAVLTADEYMWVDQNPYFRALPVSVISLSY